MTDHPYNSARHTTENPAHNPTIQTTADQQDLKKTDKPLWGAPERNKAPIMEILSRYAIDSRFALEIGSGTGQHAVHFAKHLPHLYWQCTDQAEYLTGIHQWVNDANLPNLHSPIEMDINAPLPDLSSASNPDGRFDLIYTANTLHIMSWQTVQRLFQQLPLLMVDSQTHTQQMGHLADVPVGMTFPFVIIYGPFNYAGNFTSQSNAEFDASLKARDPNMGIRDIEAVIALAESVNLNLIEDIAMPANNRCLVFQLAQGSIEPLPLSENHLEHQQASHNQENHNPAGGGSNSHNQTSNSQTSNTQTSNSDVKPHIHQSQFGAQLLSVDNTELKDVFFLSHIHIPQKPYRGGVPVLFPQFNLAGGLKKHGYVRDMQWQIQHNQNIDDNNHPTSTSIATLTLKDIDEWGEHSCLLTLTTQLTNHTLSLCLNVENTGERDFSFTGGLHPYFAIHNLYNNQQASTQSTSAQPASSKQHKLSSPSFLRLKGLETVAFTDFTTVPSPRITTDPNIVIDGQHIERLYAESSDVLFDNGQVTLKISCTGFDQWMLWNPGQTQGDAMADLSVGDWQKFICIEPVIVDNPVLLQVGEKFIGTMLVEAC